MKKIILILTLSLLSAQSFAGHGVERGLVNIDDGGLVNRVISAYMSKRLSACSQGVAGELFSVLNLKVKKDKVDNGVIDYYYTVDVGYSVNGEAMAGLEVKLIDWDYSNYDSIEQKISFEVSQDHSGLCK
jgi:hypothetical protein